MAYESKLFSLGMYAVDFDASDVATNQYTAVTLGNATTATGTGMGRAALLRPTAGGMILGIIQMNAKVNESVEVLVAGLSHAKISTSAANGKIGDLLAVDASGNFLKATTGQYAVAIAHEDYQPGDTTTVRLGNFGKQ